MFWHNPSHYPYRLALFVSGGACLFGVLLGLLAGTQPALIALLFISIITVVCFLWRFEQTFLFLLVIRSCLDIFSQQGVPAAFAIGLNALILLYLASQLLMKKPIQTDRFWWFFAGWMALQSLWVILLPIGGLGFGASLLPVAMRDWARIFAWLMIYLATLQLKSKISPHTVINILFLSLILPLFAAFLQSVLPDSALPSFLSKAGKVYSTLEDASRVNGTLGHTSTFATFLTLFIGLTCWKLQKGSYVVLWGFLLGILIFFLTTTKALVALGMLCILMLILFIPGMKPGNVILGVLFISVFFLLFASTDFGRERLASISDTPLLNPHMDISRAILLSKGDGNSFNWRLAQWSNLLVAWKQHPWLGYGLGSAPFLGQMRSAAHNDYVRALVEGGGIGFLTFSGFLLFQLTWLLRSYFSASKNREQQKLCLVLIAYLSALMIGMITENIWNHTATLSYWFVLIAIINWDWTESKNPNK